MKTMAKQILWLCGMLCMAVACSNDYESFEDDGQEATVLLTLPSNGQATRVSLEEQDNSLDLTTKWTAGDQVDIYVTYNGKVEHIGLVPVKNISDDGKGCVISYKKPKVVEDGETEEYTLTGFVGTKTACTETDIFYNGSLKRQQLSKFKVPAMFSVVTGFNQTHAVFKPYGVYEILHVRNSTDQTIGFSLNGFEGGAAWNRLQGAVRMSDGKYITDSEAAEPNTAKTEAVKIPANTSASIVSWYIPNGNLISNAVMNAEINGKNIKSANNKSSGVQLQSGHAYHMYATWDGSQLRFDDGEVNNAEIETITVNGVSFNMVKVEGGTFMMGSPVTDETTLFGETPRHRVTLSSFHIGQTEVTCSLWFAVMGGDEPNSDEALYPKGYISWSDGQEFINKLNSLTGRHFRMPTEAEWEYAARGGKESKDYTYSGSDNFAEVAWCYESTPIIEETGSPDGKVRKVATKKPNELGIYDMSGNVYEWCSDWYSRTYYSESPENNPQGPETGQYPVCRGGSSQEPRISCKCYSRKYMYSDRDPLLVRSYDYGLRVVMEN